jgi:regulator of sigma E protease
LDRTISTFSALAHSKQTGVGLKDLSGPPGILALLAAYVNSDWRLALSFLVLLNINLAIINLLPVPVLDGGHIVMALVERLFGRPLPRRLVEYTTTGFAVLLIGFMLYVSINDVKRYPVFRSMFSNQGVTIEKQQDSPAGGR